MRVPCSQENLAGKDLDEQSVENWVSARAQIDHEGEEQSVVGQAVCRTYSVQELESSAECRNGVKWLKGVPSIQESVEWPDENRTAMKVPSNQNDKEGR